MGEPDPPEYRGRAFRVRRERHRLPDGREATLDAVRARHVASVVPLLPGGKVVLLRQFRPIVDAWLWEIPAGTIEPGEAPEACARRELAEEAGYAAGRLEPLGEALADPGLTDERLYLFVARDLAPVPRRPDPDESIEVAAVSLAEAHRMIARGEILDAGTLIGLLRVGDHAGG
jgi:ADP-ribose pyrophosphatase